MRQRLFRAFLGTLALATCIFAADPAKTPTPPAEDRRPFGRYLVRVCELGRGCYDPAAACKPSCDTKATKRTKTPDEPAPPGKTTAPAEQTADSADCPSCNPKKEPQKITLEQVGCDGTVPVCNVKPEYPLEVGHAFYIHASAALPVTQTVEGPAVTVPQPATGGIQGYTVTGEGAITVKAVQAGDDAHLAAPSAKIELQTADSSSRNCYGLYTKPLVSVDQPDISAIAALAGNPAPFVLATQGASTILIYATRYPPDPEQPILDRIVATLNGPLGSTPGKSFGIKPADAKPTAFRRELSIAHAAALGDPAIRITALGYTKFAVQNIGSTPGRVRITATDTPACEDWKTFLTAVRSLEWDMSSASPVTKLWFLSSDEAQSVMTSLFPPAAANSSSGAAGGAGAASGSGAAGAAGSLSGAAAAAAAGSSSNATISVSQPVGSKVEIKTDTTPCIEAGVALGTSNPCAPASSSGNTSSGPAAAAPTSGGASGTNPIPAASTISTGSIGIPSGTPAAPQLPPSPRDMLVFGIPTPGNDAQVVERNRILALLDLPRPEMIINAWVIQNSASDPRAMGDFSGEVRTLVERYNQSLSE